jgi:hypothetical protein
MDSAEHKFPKRVEDKKEMNRVLRSVFEIALGVTNGPWGERSPPNCEEPLFY